MNLDLSKRPLHVDFCSAKAARYAVMRWHYSRRMPVFKLVKFGVWEYGRFVGAIIFGCGATPEIGMPFGLKREQVCELVRVACREHQSPITKMIKVAIKQLHSLCPDLELIVSFADESQGHVGGIYQAGNWAYVGVSRSDYISVNGEIVHPKTLHSRYGVGGQSIPWLQANVDKHASRVSRLDKHKYVFPLTQRARQIITPMRKPYPKRARSVCGGTPEDHSGRGGSIPTRALSEIEPRGVLTHENSSDTAEKPC